MLTLNTEIIDQLKELDDDGSEETLKQLVKLYLDTTPVKIKKMQDFLDSGDFVNIRREAHSLRSSSLILGAEKLAKLASETENSNLDPGAEILKSIEDEFNHLKVLLARFL